MKTLTPTSKFKLTKTIVTRFVAASNEQAKSTSSIPTTFIAAVR